MTKPWVCRLVGHRLPAIALTREGAVARDRCGRCGVGVTRRVVVCPDCDGEGCRHCRGDGLVVESSGG